MNNSAKGEGTSYVEIRKKYHKNNRELLLSLNIDTKHEPTLTNVLIEDPNRREDILIKYGTMLATLTGNEDAVFLTIQDNFNPNFVYAIYLNSKNCIRRSNLTAGYVYDENSGVTITYNKANEDGQDSRNKYLPCT